MNYLPIGTVVTLVNGTKQSITKERLRETSGVCFV